MWVDNTTGYECNGRTHIDRSSAVLIARDEGINYVDSSEEHGQLVITAPGKSMAVGDRLEFIAPHVCTTANLHDHLIGVSDVVVDAVWPVEARDALQ